MGKKKATGMSKRLGFTDRATINENKDILRYNERLEREAQGLPPEEPRGRGPRGGGRAETGRTQAGSGPGARPDGGRRPTRPARPPRPPALDEEQTAILTVAYQAVVGESGLEPAAEKVIERLGAHDGFERATMAGWEVAAGGHAEERTAQEWDLLRTAWLAVRLALLEAYATFKPEAAEALAREQKQQARLAKPPRPRRRPGRGPDKRRPAKPQPAAGPRTPSPADVARHVAAHGSTPEEAAAALTAASTGVEPSPEIAPPVEPNDGADPETDVAVPDAETADPEPQVAEATVLEAPSARDEATESGPEDVVVAEPADPEDLTAEHEAYAAPSGTQGEGPGEGQMSLDL